jgi:hypothetical protein
MTDETLPVRIREANVRKVVSIGIRVGSRNQEERARRDDLVAEAIAQMGVQLLQIGTVLEITYSSPRGTGTATASNLGELADATELAWSSGQDVIPTPLPLPVAGSFDLVIVGPEEAGGTGLDSLPPSRRLLVVSERDHLPYLPQGASAYTGREDLSAMTSLVLAG